MKKKMHWMSWNKMCEKKSSDGMGFRDPSCFNLALLAKQVWRLMTNEQALVSRVLQANYFPNGSFLDATLGSNPSWTWRSILEGRGVLKEGIRKRIGNGKQVRIALNRWLPTNSGFQQ